MIRTLAWKEYREQRPVWVALAALAVIVLGGLILFLTPGGTIPPDSSNLLWFTVLVLAATYGLVCGSLLLAGEWESGTLAFLDALAGERARLWNTKLVTGVVLTFGHALLLTLIVLALRLPDGQVKAHWPLMGLLVVTVLSFLEWLALAWGLFFSAFFSNVLATIALSGFAMVLSIMITIYLVFRINWLRGVVGLTPMLVPPMLGIIALWGSWWLFCRRDRERGIAVGAFPPLTTLLWLAFRQGWVAALALTVATLTFACFPQFSLRWWPVLTLLVGVFCGTAVFAADQSGAVHRFLGDQRFPAGSVWAVKIGFWLALAFGVAWILLGGIIRRFGVSDLYSNIINSNSLIPLPYFSPSEELMGRVNYLTLWLVYGFSVSQFFALVVRKTLVAIILSLLVSAALLVLWLPSLIWGGVEAWQVFAVPVFLLVASRLALWSWAGGRLIGGQATAWLAAVALLIVAWMVGIFSYRILEVPNVGQPFDVRAFEASMPTPAQNRAGRLIFQAAEELADQEKHAGKDWHELDQLLGEGGLEEVAKQGPLLDRMFEGEWASDLHKAASLPLGAVEGPQGFADRRLFLATHKFLDAGDLLVARALQLQSRGDDQAALDHLAWALALSRNLRNRDVFNSFGSGLFVEQKALHAFNLWLVKLGPRVQLLRRALDMLNRHEAETPPPDYGKKVNYLVWLNCVKHPLTSRQYFFNSLRQLDDPVVYLALSVPVPWETARQIRLLNVLYRGPAGFSKPEWDHLFAGTLLRMEGAEADLHEPSNLISLRNVRAERLKVALALYQVKEGKPARTLEDLVPHYLPEIPLDPVIHEPFHYRVSRGERIPLEGVPFGKNEHGGENREVLSSPMGAMGEPGGGPLMQFVPAGQGILWSSDTFLVPQWKRPKGG